MLLETLLCRFLPQDITQFCFCCRTPFKCASLPLDTAVIIIFILRRKEGEKFQNDQITPAHNPNLLNPKIPTAHLHPPGRSQPTDPSGAAKPARPQPRRSICRVTNRTRPPPFCHVRCRGRRAAQALDGPNGQLVPRLDRQAIGDIVLCQAPPQLRSIAAQGAAAAACRMWGAGVRGCWPWPMGGQGRRDKRKGREGSDG